ncbi:MAG: hypothetical protein ACK53I_15385 [Phenylobacterium sp.]
MSAVLEGCAPSHLPGGPVAATAFDPWAKDIQDPRWPSRPSTTENVCGTAFEAPI